MFLRGKMLRMVPSKAHRATPAINDNGHTVSVHMRALGMSGALNDNERQAS